MSRFAKGARYLKNKTHDGASYVADKAFDGGIVAGKAVGKTLVKKTDRSVYNGYTGLKTTGFATVAAFGAAGIWGSATYAGTKDKKLMESVQADYVGSAPMQNYDGVGSAPTLGASGNMVFGLHNSRRG